jgi:hypothetical protein
MRSHSLLSRRPEWTHSASHNWPVTFRQTKRLTGCKRPPQLCGAVPSPATNCKHRPDSM